MQYLKGFGRFRDLVQDLEISFDTHLNLKSEDVIIAIYEEIACECRAFILFRENRKLYRVNGCHNINTFIGLSDQWYPIEVDLEELYYTLQLNPFTSDRVLEIVRELIVLEDIKQEQLNLLKNVLPEESDINKH